MFSYLSVLGLFACTDLDIPEQDPAQGVQANSLKEGDGLQPENVRHQQVPKEHREHTHDGEQNGHHQNDQDERGGYIASIL
ncbi:hypothetical protein A3D11_01340 [Candidatus Peribacteria bacterium RIFCSPHIGHO2_02_FULL_49_16]|nr:MAG: hypothetical protein A2880_02465 [Candidatus Peribacteria bacterium RIFCSPHIGHO2_01_FULL_49_38]OGJ59591.1 MAG: hypothetical protein A3D11_01340 [Candidatus Peribacteria bacterium RIFCSPHIGHO2_02_FULL_49_16]